MSSSIEYTGFLQMPLPDSQKAEVQAENQGAMKEILERLEKLHRISAQLKQKIEEPKSGGDKGGFSRFFNGVKNWFRVTSKDTVLDRIDQYDRKNQSQDPIADLSYYKNVFNSLPKNLKEDPEVAMAIVPKAPALYFSLTPALQANLRVAEAILRKDGLQLCVLQEGLMKNRPLALIAFRQNGLALKTSDSACNVIYADDSSSVLTAVKQNGLALEFASPALQNNYEIVAAAVQQNRGALRYASPALRQRF